MDDFEEENKGSSFERMQFRIYDSLRFVSNREINLRDDEIARLKEEITKLKTEIKALDETVPDEDMMKKLNSLRNELVNMKYNHQIQVSQLSTKHQNQLKKLSQRHQNQMQEPISHMSNSNKEISDFTEVCSSSSSNSYSEDNEMLNKIDELKKAIRIEKAKTHQLNSAIQKSSSPNPTHEITPELLLSLPEDQKVRIFKTLQSQNIALKREICRLDSMIYGRHGKYQKWKNI